jgi:hypothetical protein
MTQCSNIVPTPKPELINLDTRGSSGSHGDALGKNSSQYRLFMSPRFLASAAQPLSPPRAGEAEVGRQPVADTAPIERAVV